MRRCPDCGTPLDEVPFKECRTHSLAQRLERYADSKRSQEEVDEDELLATMYGAWTMWGCYP